jgi:hypothetical protein
MPVKSSILKRNHIITIIIVIIIAGFIGASPLLYEWITGESGISEKWLGIPANDTAAGPYTITFPVIHKPALYYFPIMSRMYDVYAQSGTPAYIKNFTHPEAGCNWAGVAGQVFGPDNNPVSGFTVVISGSVDGSYINRSGVTGSAQAYGNGGYEVQLSSAPFTSDGSLTAYLLDTELKQVAAPVPVTTYQDCQSNLLLLNYVKVK